MRLGYDERRTRLCEGSGRAADGTGQFAVIRTAEMMDMICIVFLSAARPRRRDAALARESGIVILATGMRMYEACGKLYANGLRGNGGKA